MNHSEAPKGDQRNTVTLFYIASNLAWISLFYLNAFYIIPKFFYNKKKYRFALVQSGLFIAALIVQALIYIWMDSRGHFNLQIHILINLFVFIFITSLSIAYRLTIDNIRNEKRSHERETENLKTELTLLRSQVSPHFMFNVLNNMVALARKKSDILEDSLIKLSSLMRYMLYDIEGEKVSLDKEIDYLNSYIDLQKQRFGKNLQVNVHFPQLTRPYEIEPMLLIPFVENAFKHGTGFFENQVIDIELSVTEKELEFTVKNPLRENTAESKDSTHGIGLANVRRRLNLLYGNRHSLQIEARDGWFLCKLKIMFR